MYFWSFGYSEVFEKRICAANYSSWHLYLGLWTRPECHSFVVDSSKDDNHRRLVILGVELVILDFETNEAIFDRIRLANYEV